MGCDLCLDFTNSDMPASLVITKKNRTCIACAFLSTLIILHLLGKLNIYETHTSAFVFNLNAMTSGYNLRRQTCYSIHPSRLNL